MVHPSRALQHCTVLYCAVLCCTAACAPLLHPSRALQWCADSYISPGYSLPCSTSRSGVSLLTACFFPLHWLFGKFIMNNQQPERMGYATNCNTSEAWIPSNTRTASAAWECSSATLGSGGRVTSQADSGVQTHIGHGPRQCRHQGYCKQEPGALTQTSDTENRSSGECRLEWKQILKILKYFIYITRCQRRRK